MSRVLKKSRNASLIVYHIVCPIKYRRNVITDKVQYTIFWTCQSLSENHELYFIEADGYIVTTVSTELTEKVIANYVRNQGNRLYKAIVKDTVYQS